MYDLAIIGGGPAGVAAAVYAARKRLKTILIAEEFGGQSIVSPDIQNWVGTPHLSGDALAKNLEAHVREYAGDILEVRASERADSIIQTNSGDKTFFTITTPKGSYEAKTVLVATGSSRRQLEVPGARALEHRGLTYCASCDGPLFADQDVAVVGGGNAGFETAAQLLAYCKSVTLIHRQADFARADPGTVEAVLAHPAMHTLTSTSPIAVVGEKFLQGLTVQNLVTKQETTLAVTGVFVEIGGIPATGFLDGLVKKNETGYIVTDPRTQRASQLGIWAAGDCTDGLYHQNNIAAGDAVKALENIYQYIMTTS